MSSGLTEEDSEELEFMWLKKKGVGGKDKRVQFYESFVYDGVQYQLYDCVYMNKQGEPPYIGKLVKIWENSDASKKVKVHWFFRPSEVSNHLRDTPTLENELFLASGDGSGLANLNPLEKSKWFKELPWEQRMKTSHDEGTLVLLQNLDPEFTSGEVEDIIFHAFEENCAARMVQHIAISNPHYGQAFAIFKTREAAERIVKELNDRCLMLPNNMPLIGGIAVLPNLSEKQTTFVGHFAIDKVRRQMQRDMKEAVSTSHYSQTNTIEYEMAMSWCLMSSKADRWWAKLYEQQNVNLKKLTSDLKLK